MAIKAFLVSSRAGDKCLPEFVTPTQLRLPEIWPRVRELRILGRAAAIAMSLIRAAYIARYLRVGEELMLVEHKRREEAVYELDLLKNLLQFLRADLKVQIEIMHNCNCEEG